MDTVGEFRYAEVPRSVSRVQFLLCVEVWQPLIVCIDLHLDTYYPVPPFPEGGHNREQFLIMDWPVALDGGEGFCMVLNWMKLLASVDDIVLRQDTSYCLIANISFYDCIKGSMQLGEDGS